jgi:hypothetical protein
MTARRFPALVESRSTEPGLSANFQSPIHPPSPTAASSPGDVRFVSPQSALSPLIYQAFQVFVRIL